MNRFDYRASKPRSNRHSTRVAALAAGGLVGAVALAGCSAGQLSQTASQESAVDGNHADINNVALRNVRIQAQQNTDFLRPGATVDLVLVVVNQSPDVADKLVGISTDIGKVTVTGGLGPAEEFECWISGGHISLYKAGSSTPFSLGFDVNNDGTLQTPLGAIKKMGN